VLEQDDFPVVLHVGESPGSVQLAVRAYRVTNMSAGRCLHARRSRPTKLSLAGVRLVDVDSSSPYLLQQRTSSTQPIFERYKRVKIVALSAFYNLLHVYWF